MSTPPERLAVLIDADNTSPKYVRALLDELASYGTASVKRAYGDWTTPQLGGWKRELNQYAIVPVQQFAYTTGKNSTDSMLIIDAMDLLYSGNVDAFALVSSDSDFTRLATRMRESGKRVYGLGLRKTPASLVAACDRFIYLEVLLDEPPSSSGDPESGESQLPGLESLLTRALNAISQDDGAVPLSTLGSYLRSSHPAFDPRLYKFAKLSDLVRAQPYLTVTGTASAVRVRAKSKVPTKKTAPKKAAAKKAPTKTAAPKTTAPKKSAAKKAAAKKVAAKKPAANKAAAKGSGT
jgi:uncharacterized protein (TIGR00288 family)